METLVLQFKSKKNYRLIKELAERLEGGEASRAKTGKKTAGFESKNDFLRFAGSMKNQLVSKEHLRNRTWKKRER
ncbi:MAG: hypothetical protein MUC38_15185 [Cyclobacteriaceae bacterium]|jgi:hypothetical protein|nr:hypothetical protein [Cyclobacteriaceae bacterium]